MRISCRGGQLLAACCLACLTGCGSTPQITADPECMEMADALWTAVTSKNTQLLDNSSKRLEALHAASRLPDAAYEALTEIVATARQGQWPEARKALKVFIQGQRPAQPPTN